MTYGSSAYGSSAYGSTGNAPQQPGATTVRVRVVTTAGQPIPGLSALKWSFFRSAIVGQLGAAVAEGSAGTTDANGYFSADISAAAMSPDDIGYLIITNSDGTVTQQPAAMAFCGPMAVA